MMIERQLGKELKECAAEFPVVTLLGPRQSGKTTLARASFPDYQYRLLEAPDVRRLAVEDPRGFLAGCGVGAVIDEIQRVPELLSYIQEIVDRDHRPGRFILTGSHQPELSHAVSQTLAGRTAVLTLLPLSLEELRAAGKKIKAFEVCMSGFYPVLHTGKASAGRFFPGYMQTYLERDVRSLVNLRDIGAFQKFLRLLAGRTGQLVNYSALSSDIGVSGTTLKNWIEVLKASFVVFELQPFSAGIRKRLVKSPKLFFTDVGLVSYLLGIRSADQLERDPLRGSIYENLVVAEFLKQGLNRGIQPELYFYRDSNGNEVDLIIKERHTLFPVEVKSAATFTPGFIRGISSFKSTVGDRSGKGILLYNGDREFTFKDVKVMNPVKHGLPGPGNENGSCFPFE